MVVTGTGTAVSHARKTGLFPLHLSSLNNGSSHNRSCSRLSFCTVSLCLSSSYWLPALSVWLQVSPLLPCCTPSRCEVTETALRNVISLPTRSCHDPRSPGAPTRAWSWPSARNWTASFSTPRTKTLSPPVARTDGGLSFCVTASKMTASCSPSRTPRCPATRPAGTRANQRGRLTTRWVCWSAAQPRSWDCCRSRVLTFGPTTAGEVFTAGSHQEEDSSARTRVTAEKSVSTFLLFTNKL